MCIKNIKESAGKGWIPCWKSSGNYLAIILPKWGFIVHLLICPNFLLYIDLKRNRYYWYYTISPRRLLDTSMKQRYYHRHGLCYLCLKWSERSRQPWVSTGNRKVKNDIFAIFVHPVQTYVNVFMNSVGLDRHRICSRSWLLMLESRSPQSLSQRSKIRTSLADTGSASGATFQCMQFLPFLSIFHTCSI